MLAPAGLLGYSSIPTRGVEAVKSGGIVDTHKGTCIITVTRPTTVDSALAPVDCMDAQFLLDEGSESSKPAPVREPTVRQPRAILCQQHAGTSVCMGWSLSRSQHGMLHCDPPQILQGSVGRSFKFALYSERQDCIAASVRSCATCRSPLTVVGERTHFTADDLQGEQLAKDDEIAGFAGCQLCATKRPPQQHCYNRLPRCDTVTQLRMIWPVLTSETSVSSHTLR